MSKIQDNNSKNKEENMTNACFDLATFHLKGVKVTVETPVFINTNMECRPSERAADREVKFCPF